MFQFYLSSIKSFRRSLGKVIQPCFNSTLVQLKVKTGLFLPSEF